MWAHSRNRSGSMHDLVDHLQSVAELSARFGKPLGIADWAYVAGLFHDLGKSHPDIQEYLNNPSHGRTVKDHSSAGAVYLYTQRVGAALPFVIAGHHTGLPDLTDLKRRLHERVQDEDVQLAIRLALDEFRRRNVSYLNVMSSLQNQSDIEFDPRRAEVFVRMLFSCLVDADYLDTERHFEPTRTTMREDWTGCVPKLFNRLQAHQYRLRAGCQSTPLNSARAEIYDACIEAARYPTGIFKLSVPTGMGKTISSMGFALKHAILHNKDRVIVIIPYTSIIEQTAQNYREIFGDNVVLEHHSVVDPGADFEFGDHWKLATENWDVPIVVTTTVQFFESLFGNRSSACRKLHNIANSVVILDEFQMLPLELLDSCFSMMQTLSQHYGVTFVLSSATPMALNFTISPPVCDIIPDSEAIFRRHQRVVFETQSLRQPMTWEDVAQHAAEFKQVLVVLNGRRDAWTVYRLLKRQRHDVWHLSSLMCPRHRRDVLQTIRDRLSKGLSVVLVSTQLVEAGVDIDFPVVMRSIGPLDRIAQAAGRCNREGKLEKGQVILFEPLGGTLPKGSYEIGTQLAKNLLLDGRVDLHSLETYEKYFRSLYQSVNTDAKQIEKLRRQSPLKFAEIAKRFKMIDEETVTVVVKYGTNARRLIEQLGGEGVHFALLRQLQSYTVNLYRTDPIWSKRSEEFDELFAGWYVFNGLYDEATGLAVSMYSA
jgi:CRISPR-associated endonuclease/helicase Cas3